jgi:N-acetylmuramoyl-L-alanine amidase
VRLARQAGAELFISVHGDSMSSPSGRGATIYTGAERATDLDSAKLAERENAADGEGTGASAVLGTGISAILQELTVRETRGLSHRFAGDLQSGLSGVLQFTPQPHREAGFRVLRAHDMTSVLVELGYLSNARDAHLLSSEDWRLRTAEAMARTVERFLDPRPGARAAVSP